MRQSGKQREMAWEQLLCPVPMIILGMRHNSLPRPCVSTAVQDHLLKLKQQAPQLQDLLERATSLLTSDLCQQYHPAHDLREQCREMEGKWRKLEEKLQLALEDVEEKVGRRSCDFLCSILADGSQQT